jgi:MFS transporter, DHA1 family, multidrug resistance protein
MRYANSALAANSFLRSTVAASFPLFATYMYRALGVNLATSVLGFIAVALAPVPIAFFVWGSRIRKTSRFYTPPM